MPDKPPEIEFGGDVSGSAVPTRLRPKAEPKPRAAKRAGNCEDLAETGNRT